MATGTGTAIIESAQPSTVLRDVEESAILAVWEQGKKHNLELGRLLYGYGEKYGAQGSAGNGLAQFLRKSNINEGVAYYWVNEFKASTGKGIPCPNCERTFPSKTKLKKHQNKAHPTEPTPIPKSMKVSDALEIFPDAKAFKSYDENGKTTAVVSREEIDEVIEILAPKPPSEPTEPYATMDNWFPSLTGNGLYGVRQRREDDRTRSGESEVAEWVVTHRDCVRDSGRPAVVASFSQRKKAIAFAVDGNAAPDLTDAVTDAAALAPEVSDITEKPEYKPADPVKPISEPVDLNDALTNLVDTYNSKLSTYEDSLYEDFQSGVASLVKRFGIGRVRELAGLHSTDGTGSLTVKDFLPPEEESNLSPFEKLIAKQRAEA